MANTKTIVKNTGFLYVRMVITMLIGLFSVRIVLKALGEVDYGVYNVVSGIITMLAFLNNALSSTTQRFLSYELPNKNASKLRGIFSTSIMIYFILCMLIIVLGETVGLWFVNAKLNIPEDRMTAANWIYQLSIISFCFSVMSAPYNASIIAHEKMGIYAYVSIIEAILKLSLIYFLLYVVGDKLIIYGIMMCGLTIAVFMFYNVYCRHHFEECHLVMKWDKGLFSSIGNFAKWNIFGTFSNIFSGQGINILLNLFFDVLVNTARGIAYQIDNAINTLVQNFYIAVKPQMVKTIAENKYDETNDLLLLATKVGFSLFSCVAIIFILEMRSILGIWLVDYSELTVSFARIVLFAYFFETLLTPLSILISGTGKIKNLMLTNGILTILVLPISYVFLKISTYEIIPFIVIVVINIFRWINGVFQTRRVFPLQMRPYIKIVVTLFVVSGITICLAYIAHFYFDNMWVRLFGVFSIVVLLYGLSTWFIILSNKEKQAIKTYVSTRYLKK